MASRHLPKLLLNPEQMRYRTGVPNPYAAEVGHQRRLAILAFLRAYWHEHGRSPTVRDIGAAVGLSSPNSVHTHLRRLQEDGFITITPVLARRIELTAKGRRTA